MPLLALTESGRLADESAAKIAIGPDSAVRAFVFSS
jgi:hypothetical protein